MPIVVRIEGIEELNRRFDRAGQIRVLRAPMLRSLARLKAPIKTYPSPPASGVWAANTTPRQKRAFFALLRAGRISARRTGTLGRRWASRITEGANGLTGELGNNVIYSPFVQGHQEQAAFHRGRWLTDQQVVDHNLAAINDDFRRAIVAALEE